MFLKNSSYEDQFLMVASKILGERERWADSEAQSLWSRNVTE